MPFLCLMHVHVSAWPLVRVLIGLQHLSHDKYHGGQGKVRGKTVCFCKARVFKNEDQDTRDRQFTFER